MDCRLPKFLLRLGDHPWGEIHASDAGRTPLQISRKQAAGSAGHVQDMNPRADFRQIQNLRHCGIAVGVDFIPICRQAIKVGGYRLLICTHQEHLIPKISDSVYYRPALCENTREFCGTAGKCVFGAAYIQSLPLLGGRPLDLLFVALESPDQAWREGGWSLTSPACSCPSG